MLTESEILTEASLVLNDEIKKSFEEQGHHLTGDWENSLHSEAAGNSLEGLAKNYGSIVDAGTAAARIPFGGTGKGGEGISKYIQGLFNFWRIRKPGITDKEALSLAFATAKVQKKEGMSTWASRDYSATKDRQRFVEVAFAEKDTQVADIIFKGLTLAVNENTVEEKEIIW